MNRVLTILFLLLLPFSQVVMLSGCGAGQRSAQHQQEATDIRTIQQDSLLSAHLSQSLLSKTIDIEHIVYDSCLSGSLSPPIRTVTRIAIQKTSSGSFFYGRWIIAGLMFVFLWVWKVN